MLIRYFKETVVPLRNFFRGGAVAAEVVIIGGGYGGIRALERLCDNGGVRVTLIDQNAYHYMQTEVYDFIANKIDMSEMMVDLKSFCASFGSDRVRFVNARVNDVDFDGKRVATAEASYSYDYLILAAGSRTYFPDFIPGLAEHAYGVKSVSSALALKQQFESALFDRIASQESACTTDAFNIVVGGAGLSGVEIAAEMAAYANAFYKKGNFGCRPLNVYLIDAYESVLYGMDPFLVRTAYDRLVALGVKVWHNNRIAAVEERTIVLEGGETLPYEFMIFTGGIIASTLTRRLGLESNAKGHLEVRDTLQTVKYDNVFCIGDMADIRDERGELLAPTAQLAERSAEHAAGNIRRLMRGSALRPFRPFLGGVMVALGGEYGAGVLPGGIRVKGYLAYLVKQAIFRFYKHPLRLRTAIGGIKRQDS